MATSGGTRWSEPPWRSDGKTLVLPRSVLIAETAANVPVSVPGESSSSRREIAVV